MRKSAVIGGVVGLSLLGASAGAFAAVGDANGSRYTDALNLLEAKGYVNFSNFHKAGNDFQASVTRNGRQMTVMVDPDNRTINPMP